MIMNIYISRSAFITTSSKFNYSYSLACRRYWLIIIILVLLLDSSKLGCPNNRPIILYIIIYRSIDWNSYGEKQQILSYGDYSDNKWHLIGYSRKINFYSWDWFAANINYYSRHQGVGTISIYTSSRGNFESSNILAGSYVVYFSNFVDYYSLITVGFNTTTQRIEFYALIRDQPMITMAVNNKEQIFYANQSERSITYDSIPAEVIQLPWTTGMSISSVDNKFSITTEEEITQIFN